MKNRAIKLAATIGSALLCFGCPTFAQQDVTIDFTGVANPNVQALDAYAGYYTGSVNGITETPGFICDDYNNEIFLPSESWQATATSFASLATSSTAFDSTLFHNTIGLSGYAAIASLSSQMAATLNGPTTPQEEQQQADIAAAIWYIGSVNSIPPNQMVPFSDLDQAAQNLVTSMLNLYGPIGSDTDQAAISELEQSSLWLYTPTGADINPSGDPFPQEFVGNVAVVPAPEGGTALMYLLIAGISCFGAMFFYSQRQIRSTVVA